MLSDDICDPWERICSEISKAVTDSVYHLWLKPLKLRTLTDDTLVVEAPDEIRCWVTDRYANLIRACAHKALNRNVELNIIAPNAPTEQPSISADDPHGSSTDHSFNPRFTFDQFVIGDCNRLAHAAALAVAELPGLAYNPLFLCGKPGLGKTHLLHSIANYIQLYGNGLVVRYTTVEAFTNHFLSSLNSGSMSAFKAAYRTVNVLLVDDVQFLQSKLRTEQEFFHTFNALHQAGAQLVLTSDRPPRDMSALEDRLRERFEAGLVTEIGPPGYETRLTILRKRTLQDGLLDVDTSALELIAELVEGNVRALEGALIRVVAFASLTGKSVSVELVREVIAGLYPHLRTRTRSVQEIQERISAAFGISVDELVSSSRAAPLSWPRQLAMYLSRELTNQSLPAIGEAFGGRAHTTVMHACKRAAARIAKDPQADATMRRLSDELRS